MERKLEVTFEEPYKFVVWIDGVARKKFNRLADAISYCSIAGLDVVIRASALEGAEALKGE